jgi:chitodextrinase
MKQAYLKRFAALAAVALTAAACTMKEQDAPALTGPSEFGQSITVSVTPDVLTQDGASQSVVAIAATGSNGAPLANIPLRAEILVNGIAADFGSLSARNLVTDANGRATLVYTAPSTPAGATIVEFSQVSISIRPVGNDFGNSVPRLTTLRLVPPPGIIVVPPAVGLIPAITFEPAAPTDNQTVTFDGSESQASATSPIVDYRWDFGDGATSSGIQASHVYSRPGQYTVTLTVVDGLGRSRSTSRTVTVTLGATPPSALFNFSPTTPAPGQRVFFNASESTAAAGRRIVSYRWVFGDGTTSNDGPLTSQAFANAGTYVVTLTVTDDLGSTATARQSVTVGAP